MYRMKSSEIEILLAHPGGPFWKKKDLGAWSIPKGEYNDDEEPLAAAIREFKEETGIMIEGQFIQLEPVKQKSGKIVRAWAIKGDPDISKFVSNKFSIEWPPKSGKINEFPEIDQLTWFNIKNAKEKIIPSQIQLIEDLLQKLNKAEH